MPLPLIELTASIVSAHAASTELTSEQLLQEIQTVHAALKRLEFGETIPVEVQPAAPAMEPKKSIQKNQVVCLICGKSGLKTLARHLKQEHDMKPAVYRKQFGLPVGTALVDKGYSEERRQQALKNNLAGNLEKARAAKGKKQAPAIKSKAVIKKNASVVKPETPTKRPAPAKTKTDLKKG